MPTEAWEAFEKHRRQKKQKITAMARTRLLAKLRRMHEQGQDVEAALWASIENGWTGVFEPKQPASHTSGAVDYELPAWTRGAL